MATKLNKVNPKLFTVQISTSIATGEKTRAFYLFNREFTEEQFARECFERHQVLTKLELMPGGSIIDVVRVWHDNKVIMTTRELNQVRNENEEVPCTV